MIVNFGQQFLNVEPQIVLTTGDSILEIMIVETKFLLCFKTTFGKEVGR